MIKSRLQKVREDCRAFDKNNRSEKKVLASHYFSCYRGRLVLRTNTVRSASFGILFISRKVRGNPEDLVRHEYGHFLQLQQLGWIRYLLCIGLPSWRQWGSEASYYDRPWEITADLLGGVKGRIHKKDKIVKGREYLLRSEKEGRKVWKTIR